MPWVTQSAQSADTKYRLGADRYIGTSLSLVFLDFSDKIGYVPNVIFHYLPVMSHRIFCNALFVCLCCLLLPFLSGCGKKAGAGGPPGGTAAPLAEVIVDSVGQEDVQIYIVADAVTVPSNQVMIRARVGGFLEELFFKPGAIVRKGDRLALIEQASYQIALSLAEAELANSEAQASLARANLERQKILLEQRAGTAEDVQTQQAAYDMACARVEMAHANIRRAKLDLEYTDIRAPITGKTTKNLVDIGNYVNPTGLQALLLGITQLDPMYVEFKLNDRQFIDLKDRLGFREAFQEAPDVEVSNTEISNMEPLNSAEGEQPEERTGRPVALTGIPIDVSLMTGVDVFSFDFNIPGKIVALVDNQINFSTANITIRAEVANPLLNTDDAEDYMIYPGQVGRVRIPYEVVEDAILIREEAILTDLDTKYVLVVTKEMRQDKDRAGNPVMDEDGNERPPREVHTVTRRDIQLGRLLDSQMRIVRSGLQPGESYIVHGVQRVRIGTEVQPTTLEDYNARRAAEMSGERSGR